MDDKCDRTLFTSWTGIKRKQTMYLGIRIYHFKPLKAIKNVTIQFGWDGLRLFTHPGIPNWIFILETLTVEMDSFRRNNPLQMSSVYHSLAETPFVAIISKQYNMFVKFVNDIWVENFNILIILRNYRRLICLNGFDLYPPECHAKTSWIWNSSFYHFSEF